MRSTFSSIRIAVAALTIVLTLSIPVRADQVTLAPDGAGDLTELNIGGTASTNWEAAKTNDGDDSFVENANSDVTYYTDLYNLQSPSVSGTVNWVRVYVRARRGQDHAGQVLQTGLKTAIKIDAAVSEGTAETLTNNYADYYMEYATKPGGASWTWTDVEALQAGVALRRSNTGQGNKWSRATRVWVVVDYTPSSCEGLSHGYWKNHFEDWPLTGYSPDQTLASVFAQSGGFGLGDYTLLEALNFAGGSALAEKARILLRNAVAAVLNAAHPNIDYPRTVTEVIADVNAALASGDAATILALEAALDVDNNLGGDIDS
jgi:hypothetical protein